MKEQDGGSGLEKMRISTADKHSSGSFSKRKGLMRRPGFEPGQWAIFPLLFFLIKLFSKKFGWKAQVIPLDHRRFLVIITFTLISYLLLSYKTFKKIKKIF